MTLEELSEFLDLAPDFSQEIGDMIPDLHRPTAARHRLWELCAESDASGDVTRLLDDVVRRASPLVPQLRELRDAGCVVKFEIVQYLSPNDPAGPGFVLSADASKVLSDLGCDLEVALYVADDWDSE